MSNTEQDNSRSEGASLTKAADPDEVDSKQRNCYEPMSQIVGLYPSASGSHFQGGDYSSAWASGEMPSYGGSPNSGSHSLLRSAGVGRSSQVPTTPPGAEFNSSNLFSSENLTWRSPNEHSEVPGKPPSIVINKRSKHTPSSEVGGALDIPNIPTLSISNIEKSDDEDLQDIHHVPGLPSEMNRARRTVRDTSPDPDHPVYSPLGTGNAPSPITRDWFIEPNEKEKKQHCRTDKLVGEFQPYNLCSTNWKYAGQPNDYPGLIGPPGNVFSEQSNPVMMMGMPGASSVLSSLASGSSGMIFPNHSDSTKSPAKLQTQLLGGHQTELVSSRFCQPDDGTGGYLPPGVIAKSTQQPIGPKSAQLKSRDKPSNSSSTDKRQEREYFYPTNDLNVYNPPKKHKLPEIPQGPVYSLKVGYVATGLSHTDRSMAHIALVNQTGEVIHNIFIKQEQSVVSYLTPLTTLTEDSLMNGWKREDAIAEIQRALPPDAILVGHRPGPDIQALRLVKERHFRKIVDLKKVWQVWNPSFQTYTRFTMDHLMKTVLNIQDPSAANAVHHAVNCVKLWNVYLWCRDPTREKSLRHLRRHIIESPRIPSYAAQVKTHEGVCLGAKRACVCSKKDEWDPVSPITKGIYCSTPKTLDE